MATPEHVKNTFDVLIIGAGPSGAVAAKRFSEEGFSVICLEQGEFPDYTKIKSATDEFELAKDVHFSWYPNRRQAPSDYPINDDESDVAPLMWNGVGGSSVLYAAAWHRFKPSDFRVRTLDGVADDWPLDYAELAPFYERVERDFSVSGMPGDPAYPYFEPPLPPFPLGAMERRFAAAHDRLGWHWWQGTNAIASVKHGNLLPCVRRGSCLWGCFDGAKASVDRTHWPVAIANGAKLVQNARVLQINTDSTGLATGATYVDRSTGETYFQPARTVFLGANGIGTPRLLLNSASSTHPDGLANSSGMVGKRLMMHPYSVVVGLFDDFFEGWQGPYGQRAYSLEFQETHPDRDFIRGAKWQLMGTGGPLAATGSWPFNGITWGEGIHKEVNKRFGHSAEWSIIAEDLPNEGNTVTLDTTLTDSDGLPAPRLRYRTSDNTLRLLDFNQKQAEISMKEAGAYETIVASVVRETGWHLLGTATMGTDPTRSVVDGYGRAHDVRNLFIVDGSVMPTSGCVNPTGTVAALALRTTEHAIETAREQQVSMAVR